MASTRCKVCYLYYNPAQYTTCPWCEQKGHNSVESVPEKKAKKWSFFKKAEETPKAEEPDRIPKQEHIQTVPLAGAMPVYDRENSEQASVADEEKVSQETSAEKDASETAAEAACAPEEAAKPPKAVVPEEKKPTPDPTGSIPLSKGINLSGRTVGKYISNSTGEVTDPVVGWIVSVKGECYGQSFPLHKGFNRIGRLYDLDVKLMNDRSVSRECVAIISFDTRKSEFGILPGEGNTITYLNEEAVYGRTQLAAYDMMEFGDSGLNKYIFVPFCNEEVNWKVFQPDKDE